MNLSLLEILFFFPGVAKPNGSVPQQRAEAPAHRRWLGSLWLGLRSCSASQRHRDLCRIGTHRFWRVFGSIRTNPNGPTRYLGVLGVLGGVAPDIGSHEIARPSGATQIVPYCGWFRMIPLQILQPTTVSHGFNAVIRLPH